MTRGGWGRGRETRVRAWWYRGRAEVAALVMGPIQLHFAGMTKTQTVRVIGFVLIK